ncbi:hypothetical protein LCGC14_0511370, partial [marine sediment metagenome]
AGGQFEPEGSGASDTAEGYRLVDGNGNYIGTIIENPLGPGMRRQPWARWKTPFILYNEETRDYIGDLAGGSYMTDLGRAITVDKNGNIVQSRVMPQTSGGGGGGGGSAGLSFAQELELLEEQSRLAGEREEAQREFQGEESALDRAQRERLEELSRENEQRLQLVSSIHSLHGEMLDIQGRAREMKAQLIGNDPLRAAVGLQGGVQRGSTPAQSFMGELGGFIRRPPPDISLTGQPNADLGQLGALQRGLVNRLQLPQAPSFGLAHGAQHFALSPGEGVLVGEGRGGEGLSQGTAEVIVQNDDGTIDVIPVRGGAQGGARLTPSQSDRIAQRMTEQQTGFTQPFETLFAGLGFAPGQIPMANRANASGFWQSPMRPGGFDPLSGAADLQRLGIRPNLVSIDGVTYFFDQEGGLGQRIAGGDFQDFGFRPQDVTQLTSESAAALGLNVAPWAGPQLTDAPALGPSQTVNRLGTGLLRMQTPHGGEMFLPDPAAIAADFRNLDTGMQTLLLQSYELSGLTALGAIERMEFFTPTGTAVQGPDAGPVR